MKSIIIDGAIEYEPSTLEFTDTVSINQSIFRVTIGATIHFGQN